MDWYRARLGSGERRGLEEGEQANGVVDSSCSEASGALMAVGGGLAYRYWFVRGDVGV